MFTHPVGWSLSPQLVVIVSALLIGYCFLVRFKFPKRSLFFFSGLTLITIALAAPMGPSKYHDLFSAHMFQHILFLMMSPPLLVSGLPEERLKPFFSKPAIRKIAKRLFNPFFTWILGVSTMWFWHVPAIYNFMVLPMHPQWLEPVMKGVEAASLIAVGIVYCWPILSPLDEYRLPSSKGIVYLFSACTGCSILGMLLVFSSPGMYVTAFQGSVKTVWDMTASLDQQVGGLLMWVPGCFIYLSGVIVLLTRWFSGKEEERASRTEVITSEHTIKI